MVMLLGHALLIAAREARAARDRSSASARRGDARKDFGNSVSRFAFVVRVQQTG
jgi:hypothetical protein